MKPFHPPAQASPLGLLLSLALGLLAPLAAHAQLGTAIGGSIGESLPQYRAFQHANRPTLLETSRDVIRVPASRVLGLMALTLGGPHAGATRVVSGRGIALEAIQVVQDAAGPGGAAPTPSVSVSFSVRSSPACPEPATCVPYAPPIRELLLVPAVTADTLAGTPIVRGAFGSGLALVPEPGASTYKAFTPAEQATLPAVSGARALLPYGFVTENGGPTPGVVRLAFRLSASVAPTADLSVVFAVIDATAR